MKGKFLSLALLLLYFNLTIAQEKKKDSIKTEQLKEVVVTAQFTPTSEKNAVYKVTTINQKTIQSKAITNLTDLLQQELNMDFSFNPVFGAGIEINGISKENIKILVDGVPLIGRVNGVLNLNQINLDNIERIEIIEGPVSVFYGTDAMGGIINLITKKDQKKSVTGNVSTMYQTINLKDINASIGLKDGKSTFQFGAGYTYFNGINTDTIRKRSFSWPTSRRYYKEFKFLQDLGNFQLQFKSNFSDELVETLGEIKHHKATDINYTTRRFDNSLNLQGTLNNKQFIDFTVAYLNYDRFDTSYKFVPATNTITLIEDNPNANANYFDTFFLKLQYANSNKQKPLNYVIGLEYEKDFGKGNRILNNKQQVENISAYTSINYKIGDNLELQPAVRYTHNNTFGNFFSPAFNAKYKMDNQNILRFAYGNGYRAPSIKELYLDWHPTFGPFTYNITGNENLKLETSHSFILDYSLYRTINTSNTLKIEPSISYNQVKDLIGLTELVNFSRHYINLNEMKSLNIVIKTNYNVADKLQLNLGFSYLGRYLEYTDTFNSGGFMFTPSANLSVNYNYKPMDIAFNIFYKYSGKRKGHYIEEVNGTDVLKESTRQDFSNLDASVSKSFFKNKWNLALGAKDIFNVKDIETFNQIGVAHERNSQLMGTSYFIKLNYKF